MCESKLPTTSNESSFISVFFRRKRKEKERMALINRRKIDSATKHVETVRITRQEKIVFYRNLVQFFKVDRYTRYGWIFFLYKHNTCRPRRATCFADNCVNQTINRIINDVQINFEVSSKGLWNRQMVTGINVVGSLKGYAQIICVLWKNERVPNY